jgi:hypothetical protein
MGLLTLILVILVALVAAKWYNERNKPSLSMALPKISSTGGNWNDWNDLNEDQTRAYGGALKYGGFTPRTGSRLNVIPIN